MYLNVEYITSEKLSLQDVFVLQLIKQQRTEVLCDVLALYVEDDRLDFFFAVGYIEQIKGKKNDNELSKLRLTKKGADLLSDCETPVITKGDLDMFEYLCGIYLEDKDKDRVIGNKKKTKMYCAIFRNRVNLTLYEMYWLCWLFLQEYKFTIKLENIFFDSNKHKYGNFETHFEDSPLYQYLDENKQKVEQLWLQKIKVKE